MKSKTTMQLHNLETVLQQENADYSIIHDSVCIETAQLGAQHYNIPLEQTTPTLVLKTKDSYVAVIICGNRRISFKKLKQLLHQKDISMAAPALIESLTGSPIGQVCLINTLPTFIDTAVLQNIYCYGGSGVAHATLRINTKDLVRITKAQVLDFTDPR